MNKTVNINLAGVFFHIDEDAFLKLNDYLNAIKKSFTDAQGREEIIQDIEARIAELFSEKIKSEKQVVSIYEVEAVIEIMGQPEDYRVDDDIFEDEEPKSGSSNTTENKKTKKLYRDREHSYIAGVSSGLGHYLHIDAIWVRILFVLLTIISSGSFAIVYIIFWIIVPEALTTSEKLEMKGEPINISNIEKKVKEGFDTVSDKFRDVDYKKYTQKANQGSSQFFQSLGDFIVTFLKIIGKFIGILILLFAGLGLIGLLFSILSIGTFGIFNAPWMDYVEMVDIGIPIWLASVILFLSAAIPLFLFFLLGLKIVVSNLKSIGTFAKLTLLAVWLLCIFTIAFLGIRQATQRAFEEDLVIKQDLPIRANDTLYLKMRDNDWMHASLERDDDVQIKYNQNDEKILFSKDIRLIVRSTTDSLARVEIIKSANGHDYAQARERANKILFHTEFENNTLYLDGFFTTDFKNKYFSQEVKITLYLPEGAILFADENTRTYHRNYSRYEDMLESGQESSYLVVEKNKLNCSDCDTETSENPFFEESKENPFLNKENMDDEEGTEDWYQENEEHTNAQKDSLSLNKSSAPEN
ncbi:PspC domain-containing protein [Mesonia sp. MT50]|uniref:PspC domain-containing protein n=1 Tax=Mesonia profundi TaxID=3070998 RepID=A0ABU1A203_9FLAO|nr:PspC domain-containing protein [Mesonia profundi]MDQ7917735.1 PspC domain-containing protein [Mesonia profundi]